MKCEICGGEATTKFSPDLDVGGLGACEKHERDMRLAYYILCQEGEAGYTKFIISLKRESKKPAKQ